MAQSFVDSSGQTLIVPSVVSSISIQQSASGLATNGVIVLLGESNSGPDFTQEANLNDNAFGPDQYTSVLGKYGTGRIADAFLLSAEASNDPQITGSPSRIIIVKTNVSTAAAANLKNADTSTYTALTAKLAGSLGNLLYTTTAVSTAEVLPTTGAFTWVCPAGTANLGSTVNGVTGSAIGVSANMTPAALVTAINGAAVGLTATGGAAKQYVTVSGTLAVAVASTTITVTATTNFNVQPAVGDTLMIPTGSAIAGAAAANVGSYVVLASTVNTVTAIKKSNGATGASATPGTITNPVTVAAVSVAATTDVSGFGTVVITNTSATIIQGAAKTLELAELTTGTDLLSRYTWVGSSVATWVSKSGAPQILTGTQQAVTTTVNRGSDNTQETWSAGGTVALKVSYLGTSGTITITATGITTTVAGGSGANLTYNFANGNAISTIGDLAGYINNQTGYSAAPANTSIGQLPATALDYGTFAINSNFGAQNGQIKNDAYSYQQAVANNSSTVMAVRALSGLPVAQTATYLVGGAKGGTTDAQIQAALVALQNVRCNFIVPLISQDASKDITLGFTDPSSTYTIAATNAACRSHVLLMSTLKRQSNRQAFCSIRDTFANAKNMASNMASNRVSMNFQDVKALAVSGGIVQFQPWMGAVAAASMQAAGFYRSIVNKFINISGAVQAAGDYSDQDSSATEAALLAGLLPITRSFTGGFKWVSDQTTYGKDNNFSLNSIQSTYVTDIVALSAAQQMADAFVGADLASTSAGVLLSYFSGIMADFLRLKLLAPSAGAPGGFTGASVVVNGPSFIINAAIYINGAIYFGKLNFLVNQVTGSAS